MAKTGDINVTIYQGNRHLWSGGKVRLRLIDPFSDTEKVLVDQRVGPKKATINLQGVPADRGQRYTIVATCRGFRTAAIYPVRVRPGGLIHAAVMLVRKDPEADFSEFSYAKLAEFSQSFESALTTGGITETEFAGLEPERKAGALNIEAKLRETLLGEVPSVDQLVRIDAKEDILQDRILCHVNMELPDHLRSEIKESGAFRELMEWENELFHDGYPISFKQRVPFGSLQFSFAKETGDNQVLAADIDIDLFTAIGHLGEVARNLLTGQKTDPFTVYVQLFDQRIFPLYVLKP